MDDITFKRILTTFADNPADVNLAKGELLVQVRDELISVKVSRRESALIVTDGGVDYPAHRWLVERIARLPLLADRILSYVEDEPFFVVPTGRLVDEIERATHDDPIAVNNAVDAVVNQLSLDRVGTALVSYLTSDAGEGKTTIINTIARQQSDRYKKKSSSFLVVPIELGGRPFLRFDDVVAAALLNRFRFPLFFDSFLELVRMRVIVPALDGFEEMFVEGAAGDAASALGNLMSALESSGSVVVAARQAYFDYKSLDTQARLYDALRGQSVSFSCVRVDRWGREQFTEFLEKRNVADPHRVYDLLTQTLKADHPLLTRAVLVKHLAALVQQMGIEAVIEQLDRGTTDHFGQLVHPILARESIKWVDTSGEPLRPLLTEKEHILLLEGVALEMWSSETSTLPADVLEWAAELFCESNKKGASATRQVAERIKQHALLVNTPGSARGMYQFDHEEFFHYFLGRAVASVITEGDSSDVKKLMRRTLLPQLVIEVAGATLNGQSKDLPRVLARISAICKSEPGASFVRENAGAIVIRAIDGNADEKPSIERATFDRQSLKGRRIDNVRFVDCEFAETEVNDKNLSNVVFDRCRFELLDITSPSALAKATLVDCDVRAIAPVDSSIATYSPARIKVLLTRYGGISHDGEEQGVQVEADDSLKYTERVIRKFIRSSEVNENTIRLAAGPFANQFFRDVLPRLEKQGVLVAVRYGGAGQQGRYRLAPHLQRVSDALKKSEGSFERFIVLLES